MPPTPTRLSGTTTEITERIAESVLTREGMVTGLAGFHDWFTGFAVHTYTRARSVPLDELAGWSTAPGTGDIVHDTGRFFRIEGIEVHVPDRRIRTWNQPIINQPEVGVLGILVKEFGGVLHCLMQAKAEPGNHNGLQLSPTVQATRSNYTRVHGGRDVPYLAYFRDTARHQVIADVRQSEQGSWFRHKRNRNMIVEVTEDVPLLDGFCWLTLGQVHQLLAVDDLINMDTRTVLSCFPFAGDGTPALPGAGDDGFRGALARSCGAGGGSLNSMENILSWITESRSSTDVRTTTVPLARLPHWQRAAGVVSHVDGLFFDVIGVEVEASGREVGGWMQPMIRPKGAGLVAFLVKRVDGVLHVLVHARVEPGYVDVIELAPTVQCTPDNIEHLPPDALPRFLDAVLTADRSRIRFDTTLSEEGGRFFDARTRYVVVEVDDDPAFDHPDFRWATLRQLVDLLRHSHYLNVQARSLVACLHSLSA
ncbi:NDP-hexose 2,3-dehydratase family protein [Amycolatopsis sp. NPDC059027]|uniref:NDP-hexose 2,3-dehydratase family protein n=1 Tax=unclassified Amycolatopsis TaxID=2618356 RepID=UPI00366A61C1